MTVPQDDPRLNTPQCFLLQPVENIHHNEWFTLRNRGGYFTIEYNEPQVVILPVVESSSIVMVSVKRPVVADCPLELPAGGAEHDETPLKAAARELREETGVRIDNLQRFKFVSSISVSPNRYPVLPWIYQIDITEKEFNAREDHDCEIEDVFCFPFREVMDKIINGEVYVGLPLAIISRFLLSLR